MNHSQEENPSSDSQISQYDSGSSESQSQSKSKQKQATNVATSKKSNVYLNASHPLKKQMVLSVNRQVCLLKSEPIDKSILAQIKEKIQILEQLKEYNPRSEQIGIWLQWLGLNQMKLNQDQDSYISFRQAIEMCSESGQIEIEHQIVIKMRLSTLYYNLAILHYKKEQFRASLSCCHQAVSLFLQLEDHLKATEAINLMANVLAASFKDYQSADKLFLKAMEDGRYANNIVFGRLYHSYGVHLAQKQQFEQGLRWMKKALTLINKEGNSEEKGYIYVNISNCLLLNNKFQAALQYLLKGMEYIHEHLIQKQQAIKIIVSIFKRFYINNQQEKAAELIKPVLVKYPLHLQQKFPKHLAKYLQL